MNAFVTEILDIIRQKICKYTSKTCQQCKILLQCRIQPTILPFIKTSVDYFGSAMITMKRSDEKRYSVLFTCTTNRSSHLELKYDLQPSSPFIMSTAVVDKTLSRIGRYFRCKNFVDFLTDIISTLYGVFNKIQRSY